MKILETQRLCLRELVPDDQQGLMKVLSDPESMKFYPHPFSEEEVKRWIQWNLKNYKKFSHGLWAVILKDGERLIGDCGITMQAIGDEILPEIGFHIIKEYCNRGYATEAALACKVYAFQVLHYPKIIHIPALRICRRKRSPKRSVCTLIDISRRTVPGKLFELLFGNKPALFLCLNLNGLVESDLNHRHRQDIIRLFTKCHLFISL